MLLSNDEKIKNSVPMKDTFLSELRYLLLPLRGEPLSLSILSLSAIESANGFCMSNAKGMGEEDRKSEMKYSITYTQNNTISLRNILVPIKTSSPVPLHM